MKERWWCYISRLECSTKKGSAKEEKEVIGNDASGLAAGSTDAGDEIL